MIFTGVLTPRGHALADTPWTADITATTTWTLANSPYVLQNNINISNGITLTVDPGVTVRFKSTNTSLYVNGTLNAVGTATSSIYFTSNKDTATSTPQAGDWGNIYNTNTGTMNLNYATVRYGGSSQYMIFNAGGNVTIQNSIIATSSKSGIWHGSGTTNIASTTINSNGEYGVKAYYGSGTVSVTNSTFYNNALSAGYFLLTNGFTLTNSGNTNSPTGAGKRGFTLSGSITSNTTLTADGLPYIISGGLSVSNSGSALTINPGAVVKFENTSSYLQIGYGTTLTAKGTLALPIYFTSLKDDTAGNDTDGIATTTPQAGDWGYIQTDSNAKTTMEFSKVRYGGYGGWGMIKNSGTTVISYMSEVATSSSKAISQSSGTLVLVDVDIHGQDYGIYATGGTVYAGGSDIHACTYGIYSSTNKTQIDSSEIHGTSYGIYVAGGEQNWVTSSEIYNNSIGIWAYGGKSYASSNSIHDNSTYGIYNSSVNDTYATYNYWGASDGPSEEGTGSGDPITVKVIWEPFLTEEHQHYVQTGTSGTPLSSVDGFKDIDWGFGADAITSSSVLTALYSSIDTWNDLGEVTIATTTWPSTQDLTIASTTRPDAVFAGEWTPVFGGADTLVLNSFYVNDYSSSGKQWVITHEFGHALGLAHSFIGNIMNYIVPSDTSDPSLKSQDESDYHFLWD